MPGTQYDDAKVPDNFLPLPPRGRVYTSERIVRLGDTAPSGRLRFDSIARLLQDVAEDDAKDAGWPMSIGWLLRRCAISVVQFPFFTERLALQTFCSATAARWAERTTTIRGDGGGLLQARAIWVAIDTTSRRPARLGELFERVYAPSAAGRRASVRLSLAGPPEDGGEFARPWPIRASDMDIWGHVNNAVHWEAVEDEVALLEWLPTTAQLEYNEAIVATDNPSLVRQRSSTGLDLWMIDGARLLASARVRPPQAQP
jgi:acyl-ACP thioesterase